MRTRVWARSVVTSAGSPLDLIAPAKNASAAFRSRFFDKNTSMSCPYWSTAVDVSPGSGHLDVCLIDTTS